jgi:hypothetical protein
MAPLAEMARQNMEMWAKMQASMLSAFTPAAGGAADKPAENAPDKPRADSGRRRT